MSEPSAPTAAESAADTSLARLHAFSLLGAEGSGGAAQLDDLLRASIRHCRNLIDCRHVRLWLARRGGARLVSREFHGDDTVVERRVTGSEGLAGWVLTHGEVLRLSRSAARPSGLTGDVPEFESALVVPLYRRGRPFAVIECLDKRSGDFTAEDLDRLEVGSEAVALALDYALLYREMERRALEKDVLLEVTRALSSSFDLDDVMEAIFTSLRQVVEYDAAAIYLVDPGTHVLEMASCAGYPDGSEEAFELQVGQGIVGWVAKHGTPVIVPDVRTDPRYVSARAGTRSELAAPMMFDGRVVGVFNLESDQEDAYHEGHIELVTAFSAQAAVAVERARTALERVESRRLEKELAIARDIQRSFLPAQPPSLAGLDLAGASITHDEVGGDYFDFIPVSSTRLGLVIADVSGKGIPAALLMAGFRMGLLAEIRNEFAIRAVVRKANALMHESTERDKFVTMFYGVLDWKNRVLIFSNAGHNPPLLLRADGSTAALYEGGVALGVLPEAVYEERPVALHTGDVLVLYTDGVSEAEDEAGEQFGPERLERVVREHRDQPAAEIVRRVVAAVEEWAGERGPSDDLTLLIMRVLDPSDDARGSSIT